VINGRRDTGGGEPPRFSKSSKEAETYFNRDRTRALSYLGHNEYLETSSSNPESILGRQQRIQGFAGRFGWWLGGYRSHSTFPVWGNRSFRRASLQRHFFGNMNFPLIRVPEQYRARAWPSLNQTSI